MFSRFISLFGAFFFFVLVSLTAVKLEAQGYFRVTRPVDEAQKPLSATLLPSSVGPELDMSATGQRPRDLVIGTDGRTRVALPTPQSVSTEQKTAALFRRGITRAILAWNGKSDAEGETLLILSSDWVSATEQDEAAIGILPLPGKPTSIERVPDNIFPKTKQTTDKKIAEVVGPPEGQVVPAPITYPSSIAHSVSVLDFNTFDRFSEDVNRFTKTIFDPSVQVVIEGKDMECIKQYWNQGFRFFSFDVSHLGKQPLRKSAIAYRFQSKSAYFPLAISAIGGTGGGLIDLVVITPGSINLGGAFAQGKEEAPILVKGKTAVDFTIEELRELDTRLADIFKSDKLASVRVRNFLIESQNIGGFKNDFIGVNAEPPAEPERKLPLGTTALENKYPSALGIPKDGEPQEQAEELVVALKDFSLELYRQLIDDRTIQNKNVVCSPWSAAMALAMMYEGANAKTAEEVQKALKLQGDSKAFEKHLFMVAFNARYDWGMGEMDEGNPLVLETANAFCLQTDYKFHDSYKKLLQDRFLAELFAVDFKGNPADAVVKINQWCAKNTNDKIQEIISEVDPLTRAVIMNAVYFNAKWSDEFFPEDTKPERFTHADGSTSRTQMMNMEEASFPYYETRGFKAIAMPYTGNAHMLILLPDRTDGLANLEKSLTSETLQQIDKKFKSKDEGDGESYSVNVKFPKFKFEHTAGLSTPLQKMGIKTAFDVGVADFSKMTDAEKLFVSNILQKAIIRVDEEGTEAAAITAIVFDAVSMPEEGEKVYNFYADRPFLFLIRENTDNSILFMGRVHQPEKAE